MKHDLNEDGDGLDFLEGIDMYALSSDLYQERVQDLKPEEVHPLFHDISGQNNRYIIKEELGRGAMKVVSRAQDVCLDRDVAFAVLQDKFGSDSFDAFMREARLTARLEHPNIIKIMDLGVMRDRPFFVMEIKVGHTLGDIISLLRKGDSSALDQFPLEKSLEIYLKICDAVAYAHSRGVIHLDLKPENIQVGSYGEVLVCDWGLGRVMSESNDEELGILNLDPDVFNDITLVGTIKGTPGYMAPEQIEEGREIDDRTDLYSLGAILYSILTHEKSYVGTVQEVLDQTCAGHLVPPSLRNQNKGTERLDAVVLKAMAVDPKDRYRNVFELKEEVDSFLSGYATDAENASLIRLGTLMYQRNRNLFHITGAALFLFMGSLLTFMVKIKKSENVAIEQRIEAERQREFAEDQMIIAQEQRRVAHEAKNLYDVQKRIAHNSSNEDALHYLAHALKQMALKLNRSVLTLKDFESMSHHIDVLIKRDEAPKDVQRRRLATKGVMSFVMQDFLTTRESIDQGWSAPSVIGEACSLYLMSNGPSARTESEKGLPIMSANDTISLFDELLDVSELRDVPLSYRLMSDDRYTNLMMQLVVWMTYYDGLVRENMDEHLLIVRKNLEIHNPEWRMSILNYDQKQKSLTIGGKGLYHLRSDYFESFHPSLLQSLQPKRLILRIKPFDVLDQLESLPINDLDISESVILEPSSLSKNLSLFSLTLKRGQLSALELSKIPSSIKVNFKDSL